MKPREKSDRFSKKDRFSGPPRGGSRFGGGSAPWKRGNGYGDSSGPTLFPSKCAECGNKCEVPFKPNGRKPVLCRDCFKKDDFGGAPKRFESSYSDRPSFGEKKMFDAECEKCGDECQVPFKPNGKKPVYCIECLEESKGGAGKASHGGCSCGAQMDEINDKLDAILAALTVKAE